MTHHTVMKSLNEERSRKNEGGVVSPTCTEIRGYGPGRRGTLKKSATRDSSSDSFVEFFYGDWYTGRYGCVVIFNTARKGLGRLWPCPLPSSLYQM